MDARDGHSLRRSPGFQANPRVGGVTSAEGRADPRRTPAATNRRRCACYCRTVAGKRPPILRLVVFGAPPWDGGRGEDPTWRTEVGQADPGSGGNSERGSGHGERGVSRRDGNADGVSLLYLEPQMQSTRNAIAMAVERTDHHELRFFASFGRGPSWMCIGFPAERLRAKTTIGGSCLHRPDRQQDPPMVDRFCGPGGPEFGQSGEIGELVSCLLSA
jgi:hypothetical protein